MYFSKYQSIFYVFECTYGVIECISKEVYVSYGYYKVCRRYINVYQRTLMHIYVFKRIVCRLTGMCTLVRTNLNWSVVTLS
jgi:hypothetical protein